MDNIKRQVLLENARRAWWKLGEYISGAMEPDDPMRIDIQCLLDEFKRLDDKEQLQANSGELGAPHGKKGGRPRKTDLGKLAEWDSSAGEVGNPVIFNPDILKREDKR